MSLHTPAHKQTTQPVTDMFRKGAEDWTAWVTPPAKESAPAPQGTSPSNSSERNPLGVVANLDGKTLWGARLG